MKKLIGGLLGIALLFPGFAGAQSEEQKAIKELQLQIAALVEEVERLVLEATGGFDVGLRMSDGEMRDVIVGGVEWLKAQQEDDGHLVYEYAPYSDEVVPGDHIVRQAGALYAMGEIARRDVGDSLDIVEHMKLSIEYFEDLSVFGNANGREFRCIANSSVNHTCQLGATALALAGILGLVEGNPELRDEYKLLIHDYGNYIIAMHKGPMSGFMGFFTPEAELNPKESSFSNGEALMVLARLYKYEEDADVKFVIDRTFEYFDSDLVEFDFPLYLWVMAALKDMQELWPNPDYVRYAEDYTNWRIGGYAFRKRTGNNTCAYAEGITSAYSILDNPTHIGEIEFWHRKLEKLQVNKDNTYRFIRNEDGTIEFGRIGNMSLSSGGFLTGRDKLTQRIDYTQHCITSYVQELVDIRGANLAL